MTTVASHQLLLLKKQQMIFLNLLSMPRLFTIIIRRALKAGASATFSWTSQGGHLFFTCFLVFSGRRLDIPTGRQTYRAFKVKLILLMPDDQKNKKCIKFNKDFLFKHILNYIILY
jgi:hypothetical protein